MVGLHVVEHAGDQRRLCDRDREQQAIAQAERDHDHAAGHQQARDRQRPGRPRVAEVVARERHDEPLTRQHRRLPDEEEGRDHHAGGAHQRARCARATPAATANTVNSAAAASRMSPFVCRNSSTTRPRRRPARGRAALGRARPVALLRAQKQQQQPGRGVAAEGVVVQQARTARSRPPRRRRPPPGRAADAAPRSDQIDRDDRRERQQQRQDARGEKLGCRSAPTSRRPRSRPGRDEQPEVVVHLHAVPELPGRAQRVALVRLDDDALHQQQRQDEGQARKRSADRSRGARRISRPSRVERPADGVADGRVVVGQQDRRGWRTSGFGTSGSSPSW